jgi:hypothetical protein
MLPLYATQQIITYIFRFGRHYETPLLIQSILMNLAMFALVHLCVNISSRETIVKAAEEHIFTGEIMQNTMIMRMHLSMLDRNKIVV